MFPYITAFYSLSTVFLSTLLQLKVKRTLLYYDACVNYAMLVFFLCQWLIGCGKSFTAGKGTHNNIHYYVTSCMHPQARPLMLKHLSSIE